MTNWAMPNSTLRRVQSLINDVNDVPNTANGLQPLPFRVGQWRGGYGLNGAETEMSFFTSGLSGPQIQALYSIGSTGSGARASLSGAACSWGGIFAEKASNVIFCGIINGRSFNGEPPSSISTLEGDCFMNYKRRALPWSNFWSSSALSPCSLASFCRR